MNKVTKFFFAFFLIVGLFATSRMGDGKVVSAQGAQVQWNAIIDLSPDQIIYAQDTNAKMASAMQAKGIAGKFTDGKLELSGSQSIDQLRSALFDDSAEWVDFLGGPVELTLALPAENTPVILKMQARLTAGYAWEVLASDQARYIQNGEATFEARSHGIGASVIQTIELQSKGSGDGTVQLIYRRPFEKKAPIHARLSLQVAKPSGVIDISDLTPPVEPTLSKDDTQSSDQANPYAELQTASLPAEYDSRSLGIVPAVRNQLGCGSCWAFGTVGAMETAIKKGGGPLTDLSEQFLISCNNNGWSCDGGLTATKYHFNTLGKAQTAVGAVLETIKPYTATNGNCTVALPHPYKASNWQFVNGSEGTTPTTDQIKSAIYTYGAVTARVCVDAVFNHYTGGVYSPTSNGCGGSINHQIVLVGWNDATQTWLLRNSWGPNWGEGGYMRIKYDPTASTSRVGEGASWVKYVASTVTVPTLVAPGGLISDTTPTYSFTKVPAATQYQYLLYQGTTLIYTQTLATAACGTTANCVYTPAKVLPYAAYTWKARAMTAGTWQAFSAVKAFTITNVPTPIAPTGAISNIKPSFSFTRILGATQYRYQLLKGTTSVYIQTVAVAACGTTAYCVNTPITVLTAGAYTWKVQALVGGVWSAYSAVKPFTLSIANPFNSQFTTDAAGWSPVNGSWNVADGFYKSVGLTGLYASSAYLTNYSTFTYEVKMLRSGCSSCDNVIFFRGSPAPLDSLGDWNNGYEFAITNDGEFYFGYMKNGLWTNIENLTQSSAITSGWNIVKVTMNGNYLQIFVNGTRLLYGNYSAFNIGRVGVGFWQDSTSTGDNLSIDYATLVMTAPASVSSSTEGINLDTLGPVDQSAPRHH